METAKLQNRLIITRCSAKFKAVAFAISVRAKENMRYAISCVKIDGDKIIATDGKRLHIYQNPLFFADCAPGMYEVIRQTKSEIDLLLKENVELPFPKYEDIIPTDYTDYFKSDFGDETTRTFPISQALYAFYSKGIGVRIEHLTPLNIGENWQVFFGAPDRPILCKAENIYEADHERDEHFMAIFMPHTLDAIQFLSTRPIETPVLPIA